MFLTIPGRESEQPTVGEGFMTEVLKSYEAIFQDDKSRNYFLRVEKPQLESQSETLDPCLLALCSKRGNPSLVGFRIFRRRLIILEDFAKNAVPRRRRLLCRDRRNLEESITFKAIIVFGSLGVIIGLIQIILSVLQVAYAIKAS